MTSHENTKIYKALPRTSKPVRNVTDTVTISVKIPTYNRLMEAKTEITQIKRKTQSWDKVVSELLDRITRLENLVSELETVNRKLAEKLSEVNGNDNTKAIPT